jgi:superoxide dismutase, Fe-Mn family
MEPIDRKKFLSSTVKAAFGTLFLGPLLVQASGCGDPAAMGTTDTEGADGTGKGSLDLTRIQLPYGYDALEPHIDARTMELHYDKHHKSYEDKFKEAREEENITASSDHELFSRIGRLSDKARNNGGGVWNHNLFWQVMHPDGGGQPTGRVLDAINGSFDSFNNFKEKFSTAGKDRFGSGWAWLVDRNGKLEIGSTPNQDNPLMGDSEFKGTPLLGLDVWEHAYYLKYQNKRAEYIDNWWNVVNWDEVARRMG